MKEMKKKEDFSDREWEEIASFLSGENVDRNDLLERFMNEDESHTAEQWKELKSRTNAGEINVDKAWLNVQERIDVSAPAGNKIIPELSFFSGRFMKIAATLLILISVGITLIYINNKGVFTRNLTYITGNDQKNLKVSLPDGSVIFLNRNSELTYRTSFGKHTRNVNLSGEAFFDISPDAAKPFIITAGNAQVKVIGTSFNVITENDQSSVEVFVKTGRVMLSENAASRSLEVDPGYVGKISSASAYTELNNNPNYLSWNTGRLIYNGQKLDIVFNDLRRVYNMEIIADDPAILQNLWTSPIDNQPQETIIRLICASFNLSYVKDGTVYHLSKK